VVPVLKGRAGFDDVTLVGIIGPWVGRQRLPMAVCIWMSVEEFTAIVLIILRFNNPKTALFFALFLCITTSVELFESVTLSK
jgi:hypothetical protein